MRFTSGSSPFPKSSFGKPIFIFPVFAFLDPVLPNPPKVVESIGSLPRKRSKIILASSTVFAKGPIWSRLEARAIRPDRETAPYVGLNPTTPQNAAGCLIEPPVSEPSAPAHISAATATAEPPEEPPGTLDVSWGFFVRPYPEFSVEEPIANSSMFVRPIMTAPAFLSFFVTAESYDARYDPRMREAAEHIFPSMRILSLRAIGTPHRGGSVLNVPMTLSSREASPSASSRNTSRYA